jgi:hypothetical protein
MNMNYTVFLAPLMIVAQLVAAQDITISIKANEGKRPVSPYIYGRNNSFSNVFGTATSASNIKLYKEAGLRFSRECTGNNLTKYNWRRKLSSHPDWYNNVYAHDWDFASKTIQDNMPEMQTMWGFQLIGKVAGNKQNNFNDWVYNQSEWVYNLCNQNLAGGGVVNPTYNGKALIEGNPDLYLIDWNADSTTAILDHWFGKVGLGFNKNNFQYWSMDNEPEIWSGTHDDVVKKQTPASELIDKYIDVAKKARERYPEIKLCGPVPANEWQWYKYADEKLRIDGKYYCWLEYFIKRVADEQKKSGIRLLDVFDIHFYPEEEADKDILQLHRVFFDKNYVYPGANGVKTLTSGWDSNQTKEYIFQRINDWLTTHFGENHGITLALSETGIKSTNPNVISVLYASMLGTFANNGVEIFTPWSWEVGMWETLHLFSRYSKNIKVSTTSSLENMVSGYTTINNSADSMTIVLVNRDLAASLQVTVNVADFSLSDSDYPTLTLAGLPKSESFKSHTSNALKSGTVNVSGQSFTITLPALSTTAVLLKDVSVGVKDHSMGNRQGKITLFPNPAANQFTIQWPTIGFEKASVQLYDPSGKCLKTIHRGNQSSVVVNTLGFRKGIYIVQLLGDKALQTEKLIIK